MLAGNATDDAVLAAPLDISTPASALFITVLVADCFAENNVAFISISISLAKSICLAIKIDLPNLDSAPAIVTASAKALSCIAFFSAAIFSAAAISSAIFLSLFNLSASSKVACFSSMAASLAASSSSTAKLFNIASSLKAA